jgi:Rps23 Pro-64 3,4-dihydroxylase Tpa1-like proline 4-hydroxylase
MQAESGAYQEVHRDTTFHPTLLLYRRVNLNLYLNRGWKEEYGGHFELWDSNLQESARYLPVWNRLIIHNTTARAYHGLKPITCPTGTTRRMLTSRYYSVDVPLSEKLEYQVYPDTWVRKSGKKYTKIGSTARRVLLSIVPPIVFDLGNKPKSVFAQFTPPVLLPLARLVQRHK